MEPNFMIRKNCTVFLVIIFLSIIFIPVHVYGDQCPHDPNKTDPGDCGCGIADTDSDGDGTPDCFELCDNDKNKTSPGICGCGVSDKDTDGDGVADCNDSCKNDDNKTAPGICGCNEKDTDDDNDGTPNCVDECPADNKKTKPGSCGCGISDRDSDKDLVPNCKDDCPNDKGKIIPGICGCGVADADSDGDGTADCKEDIPLVLFTSPPTINPPDDPEDGVSVGKAIEIYFNMAMNTNTNSNHLVTISDSSAAAIDGASRWQDSGRRLVFTPTDDLLADTAYRVTVKGEIENLNKYLLDGNLDGNPGGDYNFSFFTEFDADHLSDNEEEAIGTDPNNIDSDGDTIPDDIEVGSDPQRPLDSDDDTVIDALDDDSDNDSISDAIEHNIDSDGDGNPDFRDVDSDNDGKLDEEEGASDDDEDGIANYKDANDTDGPLGDVDDDRLTNTQEVALGTNPNLRDSDHDTIDDLDEVGGDPDNPVNVDTDSDGMIDAMDTDSDNDGSPDQSEYMIDDNEDGISDHLDPRIVTGMGVVMVLEEPAGAMIKDVELVSMDDLPEYGRPDADFLYGFMKFKVTGLEPDKPARIRLVFEDNIPEGARYFQYSNKDSWTFYDGVEEMDMEDGDNVLVLSVTAEGAVDDDTMEDGTVVDPLGVGVLASNSTFNTEVQVRPRRSSGSSGCSIHPSGSPVDMGLLFLLVIPVVLRFKRD